MREIAVSSDLVAPTSVSVQCRVPLVQRRDRSGCGASMAPLFLNHRDCDAHAFWPWHSDPTDKGNYVAYPL